MAKKCSWCGVPFSVELHEGNGRCCLLHQLAAENQAREKDEARIQALADLRDAFKGVVKELKAKRDALAKRFTVPVVCICGSTRFADDHAIARWMLERTGRYICLMINYLPAWWAEDHGWDGHDHFGEAEGVKQELDDLHKRKIDLADSVLVIAPKGYIGESTRAEIEYAEGLKRPVGYIESGLDALAALDAKEGETP